MRTHAILFKFSVGDRVTFQPDGRPPVVGMLTRYNKKTVTVITDDGRHWNVSPGLVRKVDPQGKAESRGPTTSSG